jgi:PiT family inorganic phosphate transporter
LQEFWQGANNVSNATAFLSATFEYPIISRTLGGVALAVGLMTLGRRVLTAAGTRIARIPIHAAMATQIVIVAINAVGTLYGLPLSGTHLSVGCLVGAGIGCSAEVDYKMCRNVILYWFLTLPGAALFSLVTAYVSNIIFP